jgi:tRNA (guanine-N7-)-methyltransferase
VIGTDATVHRSPIIMARTKTSSIRLSPDDQLQPYLLEPTGPLSWPDIFSNDHPVEVEVGCGKGLFLVSAAGNCPRCNFFGIEIAHKFARFTAAQLARHSLINARVAKADAQRVLTEWITDASVAVVHVYFPDPWWKRRHRKRRIFTDSFLIQVVRVLVPGGQLRFATDVSDYFDEILRRIESQPALIAAELPDEHPPQHDLDYLTNFERKYRKVGKPVYRAGYVKS